MKTLLIAASIYALGAINAQAADGDATKGKILYATCAGCHGASGEGQKASAAPRLQGQHEWYLITQLGNFKAGIRGAHKDDANGRIMAGMSALLADEQAIKDVAAYIGSL